MPEGAATVTTDAVVVVPGIMGSELVDADGRVQWGLKPGLLARAWLTRQMDVLHVSEADITRRRRLRATRLLRVPGYMPLLGGLEPYGELMTRVRQKAVGKRHTSHAGWGLPTDLALG